MQKSFDSLKVIGCLRCIFFSVIGGHSLRDRLFETIRLYSAFVVLSVSIRYLGFYRVLILICEYDKICSISYDSV